MIQLIERGKSGDTTTFPNRLGVSRSKLYNLIDDFRNQGVDIRYDKKLRQFYIANDCKVEISTPIRVLKRNETHKIYGGYKTSVHFIGQMLS